VLFWREARIPGRGEVLERRMPEAPRPQHLWRSALIFGGAAAVLLVVFPYDFRNALINTLIGILMALSLVLITGYVGQISVVQLGLSGAAGFTVSHAFTNWGITFPLAALAGIAVAVVIGIITAFSAVRVRGVSLAVVTLAGAVALENFGFQNASWGQNPAGSAVPELKWFGLDLGTNNAFRGIDGNKPSPVFGWVVLICCVLLCVAVGYIRRGRLGQQMLAVRSNERAAAAAAINPRTVKLYAFTIAAFIAGVAGVLYAYNFGTMSADAFDPVTALSLIAFAYAGGITLISGAVFAGLISAQAMIPYALDKWFGLNGTWFLLFGGVILIFTLIQNPSGVAGDIYRRLHKRPLPRGGGPSAPDVAPRPAAGRPGHAARRDFAGTKAVLRVTGLSVSFGGVRAVREVSLEVREGELVGLIGPNGAGKTTLVDAMTGFVPFTGKVELAGTDVSRLPAYLRARQGLARTWQSTELFDDLDVTENLTVATAHAKAVQAAAASGTAARAAAADTLQLVGMDWAADAMPSGLSAGQRKLVGVARAVVARPHVLCLDEPAAGLDTAESAELGTTLRELADQGQSMLLIEHDMGLVMSVCDRVVVLEFGQVIADGPPEVVRADPRVVAAYLGDSGAAAAGPEPAGQGLPVRPPAADVP
jgi:ABC-type branched-subunit amino acid transport system ATPase component/ABC-type branched-subunit amino acid transport system permease subunit